MDQEEQVTAWHEAGHAVMAVLCGGRIEHVSLEPAWDDGPQRYGETITRWQGFSALELSLAEIKVSLAGPIAETLFVGEERNIAKVPEWHGDWQKVLEIASHQFEDVTVARRKVSELAASVRQAFDDTRIWSAVSAVAEDLLAHETIEHEQVCASVEFWLRVKYSTRCCSFVCSPGLSRNAG